MQFVQTDIVAKSNSKVDDDAVRIEGQLIVTLPDGRTLGVEVDGKHSVSSSGNDMFRLWTKKAVKDGEVTYRMTGFLTCGGLFGNKAESKED